ncbi:ankyrin repeat domain-containing protein [Idiomarina abyssalis]|uniref:ankyrin repeat domain-containing protein n=1 Tax=Idiomarina abyssalis TaxID=86102 RepID=UPI003A8CAFFB
MKISYFSILLIFLTSTNTFSKCVCERENDPNTPINVAIIDLIRGNNATAINLLKETNNPNISNACGAGILLISSIYNDEEVTRIFLKAGADPNMASLNGLTPIENAAQWSSNEVLSMLIDAGANPNPKILDCSKNSFYNTPLLLAAINNNIEGVKILLKSGADYNHRNINGLNVFHILVSSNNTETLNDIIESISGKKLKNSIANGIIFQTSATNGKEDQLEFFLSKSFDPNFSIDDSAPYNTPLLIAALNKNIASVKILIKYGANIDYTNKKGYNLKRIIKEKILMS